MATFIVSTARGSIHSLAWQGFTPAECYDQLAALINNTLGTPNGEVTSASRCFARPVFDSQRETIDWYTEEQAPVRSFASLSLPEQESLRALAGEFGAVLLDHAKKLQAESGSPQRELGGHLLELALRYPDDSCLYLAGEQPVITCWGFGPSTAGAQPQDISRQTGSPVLPASITEISATASPVTEIPLPDQEATPRRTGLGWLWLLPLLLLLLLAAFLVTSWCGRPPLVPVPGVTLRGPDLFCPAVPAALAEERQRELELIALLDTLRAKAYLCTKAPEYAAAAPSNVPPVPPLQPEPEKAPLVIPEKAAESGDLSFLAGVWQCDTGLTETNTSSPISVLYTFDDNGTGYVAINSLTKGLCKGAATAGINAEGKLTIKTDGRIVCPTGNPFSGQSVECQNTDGQAQCTGRNLSSSGGEWNAVFLRR